MSLRQGDAVDAAFARASHHDRCGETDAAKAAYLAVLTLDPAHRATLARLGTLLHLTGYKSAALTVFRQAARAHPADPQAHVDLASALLDAQAHAEAAEAFALALRLDPAHERAHRGLAILALREGDIPRAREHGRIGFGSIPRGSYRGTGRPILVLLLASALGGNVETQDYLDDRVFRTATIVAEFDDPATPLPRHDIVFNAIGDPYRCPDALNAAQRIVARSRAPVINDPKRVRATGRVAIASRCSEVAGVRTARTLAFSRAALMGTGAAQALDDAGFSFPLLVRAPGFHTGEYFERVSGAGGLAGTIAAFPGDDVLVLEELPTRDRDGKVRKYRVIIVDGEVFPLHLAVSHDWKVHFFTADMRDEPAHRAEDAAFLDDMQRVLGSAAFAALLRVKDVLQLDYGGIDFGLSATGEVLLFEANATMVVPRPDADPRWAYRMDPVARIHEAVARMLRTRAIRT